MHPTKRGMRLVIVAVILFTFIGSGIAIASHDFNDVPNSNPFHDEISFIASRAITLGCGGGNYCPDDFVPREQMAAFMERLVRAVSPVVITVTDTIPTGTNAGQCATDPYVAPFEQVATFNGGLYSANAGSGGRLMGRVQFRVNGGSWQDVTGADEAAVPL